MVAQNTRESLAGGWQYSAGLRHARANRLGNCAAGLTAATEASILRQCAQELEAAPLAARAPEVTRLLDQLGQGEWGADQLGTLANWFEAHGYTVADVNA